MKILKYFSLTVLLVFISCKNDTKIISEIQGIQASIKTIFAPDKRVALFDIQFKTVNNKLLLEGETTSKKAFSVLLDSLHAGKLNIKA